MDNGAVHISKFHSDVKYDDAEYMYSTMTNTWYAVLNQGQSIEVAERFIPANYKAKLLLLI